MSDDTIHVKVAGEIDLGDPIPQPIFNVRPMEPGDRNFVLDSWLRSLRDRHQGKVEWSPEMVREWFATHRPKVTELVDTGSVLVACDIEEPSHDLGWLCWHTRSGPNVYDGRELSYVYVKHLFRGFGIARALWDAAGQPGTFPTRARRLGP